MKKSLLILVILCSSCLSFAQELNCRVQVNSDKIQGTNKSVFTTLEQALTNMLIIENGVKPRFPYRKRLIVV